MSSAILTVGNTPIRSSHIKVSVLTSIFFVQNVPLYVISGLSVNMDRFSGQFLRLTKDKQEIHLTTQVTQNRHQDVRQIINRVLPWSGSIRQAFSWYRSQPISAFGNQTAEMIVRDGGAKHLMSYLNGLSTGGYA